MTDLFWYSRNGSRQAPVTPQHPGTESTKRDEGRSIGGRSKIAFEKFKGLTLR